MARHNELGKKGEQLAAMWLREQGYRILKTNWRHEKEEIDIIAVDGNELVIVEVKTRSTGYFGNPEDAVDSRKAGRLIEAAEAYLTEKELDMEVRYDIVAIVIGNDLEIKHIKDAFFAGDF